MIRLMICNGQLYLGLVGITHYFVYYQPLADMTIAYKLILAVLMDKSC